MNKENTTICEKCGGSGRMPIPSSLRKDRIKSGKSLRHVADLMGISAAYLSDLELGRRGWSSGILKDFREAIS
jgi:transcriptional regulator with XRE-family HTH domain